MKRSIIIVLAALLLVGTLSFGGYRWYDTHHITSEFRQTMTALVDPSSTDADAMAYIHAARLQVHTKRDAKLLKDYLNFFDQMNSSMKELLRLDKESSDLLFATLMSKRQEDTLDNLRLEYIKMGVKPPQHLLDHITEARNHREEQEARNKRDEEIAKQDAEVARKRYQQIRRELGLPELQPEKK